MTPRGRSEAALRKLGYLVDTVERTIPANEGRHFTIRKDLFGLIDSLALLNGQLLAVQSTSHTQLSKHLRDYTTIAEKRAALRAWLSAPTRSFELWGWRKVGHRWIVTVWAIIPDMTCKSEFCVIKREDRRKLVV